MKRLVIIISMLLLGCFLAGCTVQAIPSEEEPIPLETLSLPTENAATAQSTGSENLIKVSDMLGSWGWDDKTDGLGAAIAIDSVGNELVIKEVYYYEGDRLIQMLGHDITEVKDNYIAFTYVDNYENMGVVTVKYNPNSHVLSLTCSQADGLGYACSKNFIRVK